MVVLLKLQVLLKMVNAQLVTKQDGEFILTDDVTPEQEAGGLLEVVYEDGKLVKETSLKEIRALVDSQI